MPKNEVQSKVDVNIVKKVMAAPLSTLVFRTTDGSTGDQEKCMLHVCKMLCSCFTNGCYSTGQKDVNDILFNDDDDDKLPKGSGLKKRVVGTMMDVEAEFKNKAMVRTQLILS